VTDESWWSNRTHLEAEEQAACVDVLADVEGGLSGDPERELVPLYVRHLVATVEVLHVALIKKQLGKSYNTFMPCLMQGS
jgi:hypothetical protein